MSSEPALSRKKSSAFTRAQAALHSTAAFVLHCACRLQFGPTANLSIVHSCALEGTELQHGVVVEITLSDPASGIPSLLSLTDLELKQLKTRFYDLCTAKLTIEPSEAELDELLEEANSIGGLPFHGLHLVHSTNFARYGTWSLKVPKRHTLEHGEEPEVTFSALRHDAYPPFCDDTTLNHTQFDFSFIDATQLWLRPSLYPTGVPKIVSEKVCTLVSRAIFASQKNKGIPTTQSIGLVAPKMRGVMNQKKLIEEEEAKFSFRFIACAEAIHKSGAKIVLVAGPSACGKTSTANRIALALRALGYAPAVISLDDYYRDPFTPDYPKGPDGQPNHECVEALRVDRFQSDLKRLTSGHAIQLPYYDMKIQKIADEKGKIISLGENPIVIAEGLFALSPALTPTIPANEKFNVFISPIALNIDDFHRPSCIDVTLLRRIHRDYISRNRAPAYTISRAGSVAEGSVKLILPMLLNANFFINTSVAHELAMLRQMLAPLLNAVTPSTPYEWSVAQQLLKRVLLPPVESCPTGFLPQFSVLQEFFGEQFTEELANPVRRGDATHKALQPIILSSLTPASATSAPVSERATLGSLVPQIPVNRFSKHYRPGSDPICAVILNGVLRSLNEPVPGLEQCYAETVCRHSELGMEIAKETLKFLALAAAKELYPKRTLIVEHGFFPDGTRAASGFSLEWLDFIESRVKAPNPLGADGRTETLRDAEAQKIAEQMKKHMSAATKISVIRTTAADAEELLGKQGMPYSVALLKSRHYPEVTLFKLGAYYCLALGPVTLLSDCSQLEGFSFTALPRSGFRLAFDNHISYDSDAPQRVCSPPIQEEPAIFQNAEALANYNSWRHQVAVINECRSVGDLNLILGESAANSFHVFNVAMSIELTGIFAIAKDISMNGLRLVCVSGSSGSGKSRLVTNLGRALLELGIPSVVVPLDNYYRNIDDPKYPQTPSGEPDCESPDAILFDELNEHLFGLLEGQSVEIPQFDLGAGKRQKTTKKLRGSTTGVVIVEGLFGLHDRVSPRGVRPTERTAILVHPMPVLQLDETHYLDAGSLKLIRRIVRDHNERGRDAATTLAWATNVTKAESENTVPFIGLAKYVVYSPTISELHEVAVDCSSLLRKVSLAEHGLDVYSHAQRLRSYLRWFQPVRTDNRDRTD